VLVSCRPGSIWAILLHGVSPGGVTFDQWSPPSVVRQTRPSSVPTQRVSARWYEGPTE